MLFNSNFAPVFMLQWSIVFDPLQYQMILQPVTENIRTTTFKAKQIKVQPSAYVLLTLVKNIISY